MKEDLKNEKIYELNKPLGREPYEKYLFEALVICFPYPILIKDKVNPILLEAQEYLFENIFKQERIPIVDIFGGYSPNATYSLILQDYLKNNPFDFNFDYFTRENFDKICKESNYKSTIAGNKPFDYEKIYEELIIKDDKYKHFDYHKFKPEKLRTKKS